MMALSGVRGTCTVLTLSLLPLITGQNGAAEWHRIGTQRGLETGVALSSSHCVTLGKSFPKPRQFPFL